MDWQEQQARQIQVVRFVPRSVGFIESYLYQLRAELSGSGAMSSALWSEPRDDAPPATAKPKDGDYVQVRSLLACKGEWVKVNSNIGTGWAFGLCSNQVTTCN